MAETNISAHAFDGASVWATLSSEHQARIGALALEVAVGRAISEHAQDPAARAGAEAERIALDALQDVALGVGGLLDLHWVDPKDGQERFCIPSVVGAVCTTCGCSHEDPCAEGCGWHDAATCTACAEKPALDEDAFGGTETEERSLSEEAASIVAAMSDHDLRASFAEARILTADGSQYWLAQDGETYSFHDDGDFVVVRGRHLGVAEAEARTISCLESCIPVPVTRL